MLSFSPTFIHFDMHGLEQRFQPFFFFGCNPKYRLSLEYRPKMCEHIEINPTISKLELYLQLFMSFHYFIYVSS